MATELQLAWLKTVVTPAQMSAREYGVPASVTLAQCILESAWGSSQLARRYNNYFGIKALPGQPYIEFATDEVVASRTVRELARFTKYPSAIECFEAHARLLATAERYAPAMRHTSDVAGFCAALRMCGYSTEPTYAFRLISLIDEFDLEQYDLPLPPDAPAQAVEEAA